MSITFQRTRDFLFNPFSENHSTTERVGSLAAGVALFAAAGWYYYPIAGGVIVYDYVTKRREQHDQADEPIPLEEVTDRSYDMDEIVKHNTEDDLWIVIADKVYNVTHFLVAHPGGREILLEYGGKDATDAFRANNHPMQAQQLMKAFYYADVRY